MGKRKRGELPTPAEATVEMGLKDGWICIGIRHQEVASKNRPSGKIKHTYVKLKNISTDEETKWIQKCSAKARYGTQNKKRLSSIKHTDSSVDGQVNELTKGNAKLLSWYLSKSDSHNYVTVQYSCGCIKEQRLATLTPDCPICSGKWKTENEVCKLVEEYAPKLSDKDVIISTNRQKTVHMHPNGEPVTRRFDIVIEITHREDESVKRWVAVEYNGEQHYRPVNFGNLTEEELAEAFKGNQIRDKQKSDFCKYFNIPLIIIPYWEKNNIEEIVKTKVRDAIWEQSFDVAFLHFQKNNT